MSSSGTTQTFCVYWLPLEGFTKWSSSRTPVEVFQLLEALYAAFDANAKRRRVFKIETVRKRVH